jgi:hypothetical protein
MAKEQESFETLVNEAPLAPTGGTVSLVGMLARSAEPGRFVLTLPDGRAVTLETAAVKGYAVLGTSVGQTIVRVDVDAEKAGSEAEVNAGRYGFGAQVPAGAVAPFALATAQQLPPGIFAAQRFPNLAYEPTIVGYKSPVTDPVYWTAPYGMDVSPYTYSWLDQSHTHPLLDAGVSITPHGQAD